MPSKAQTVEVGQWVHIEGVSWRVESLPTRTSAVLRRVVQKSGEPSTMKITISKLLKLKGGKA